MLSVLYAAIAEELVAINAYVAPLIGSEHVRSNEPPPKMIFIPKGDAFGPVEGPGGNPRPLATALEETTVVLQGRTTDHIAGMRDQLVIALHKAVKKATAGSGGRAGRYVLSKGEYVINTIKAVNGFEYRMTFSVPHPIVDRVWAAPSGSPPVPQEPTAATYTGDQVNTYPVVPGNELEVDTTVELVTPTDP